MTMVNVAIAGGTGAVGRTLIEVLASQTKHQAIILTRKAPDTDEKPLAPTYQVDYTDVDALTSFLEEQNIHTVISAFGIDGTSLATSQLNLIKAADRSPATKRFIPSSFAMRYPEDGVKILPPLEHYFTSLAALSSTTSLEWAVVLNGTFLEYFAPPALKSHHPPHSVIVLDMEHNAAAIPGDGNTPVTFTYTFDVARFVVAALDLDRWPETHELRIVGDELTFNEFVRLAEEIKGVKFDVAFDDVEKLKASQITELPGHKASYGQFPKEQLQWFFAIFELWMATGLGRVEREGSLNELFPEIKPLTAREMLEKYWKP
ncbi:NmrA-like family protein [Colletotrichum truncatum]|uniref:NmrA-like family protein n=1 Tax=Colletotrichum truncatum TaxID=5467 RepID=A0ACC3Z121_COLTU|nr:NmrA-like family protein [Colletotrichum truncatum]KAF6800438.1 NmrA-like family protein [Colletotrichum truncatum]